MLTEPSVHLADLLAAREDLAILEKASSASVRKNTQSNINKVIIGRVRESGKFCSEGGIICTQAQISDMCKITKHKIKIFRAQHSVVVKRLRLKEYKQILRFLKKKFRRPPSLLQLSL